MTVPIRVLVVDDSPFMRYTVAKHLEANPGIAVVGSAQDGLDALAKIPALSPDVIILDVEMPRMDGLTTLQRIMVDCPTPVVMLSSLKQREARSTIQALMSGAVDFVVKPAASTDVRTVIEELTVKVKIAAKVRPCSVSVTERFNRDEARSQNSSSPSNIKAALRPLRQGDPIIVIGASTGGPRALQRVLSDLPPGLPAAVAVVHQMPRGFSSLLAQRLNESSLLTVQEATDGDRLARGLALLAPGDFPLRFNDTKQISLDHGPRHHRVRPAMDMVLESAAEHFKSSVIGVVLTGIGSDSVEGSSCVKKAGGTVIAEHEATSLVYDMPRRVIEAGLADRVVPLTEVASTLLEVIKAFPENKMCAALK